MSDEYAQELITRYQAMKAEAQPQFTLYDQIARYVSPRKADIISETSPGKVITQDLYDTTAIEAANTFAAGLQSSTTPAGEKWARLKAKDENASDETEDWYDKCTDAQTDVFYDSNFYEANHECDHDLGVFGICCMLVDPDKERTANFINIPVGTFVFEENERGELDVMCRWWKWTARQAAQKWGKDKLGKIQLEALKDTKKGSNRKFTYLHFVEPRKGVEKNVTDAEGAARPWKSCYLCVEDFQLIEEGGYYSMPYALDRLLRKNGDKWGSGPGMEMLPTIRILDAARRDFMVYMERAVKPSWLLPDDGSAMIDNRPEGRSYWDSSLPQNKPEVIQYNSRLQEAQLFIQQLQEEVRNGFYNNLFQFLLTQDAQKKDRTAYEVQQMVAQQQTLFSPLFGRLTREFLTPINTRVFDMQIRESLPAWLRNQDGVLPIPPAEIWNAEDGSDFDFKITYVSKIALAIKSYENQSIATLLSWIQQAAPIDPSIANSVDWLEATYLLSRNIGTPAKVMRTKRKVEEMAAAQAAAQQQAMAPEQAKFASEAVRNLGPAAQQQAARKLIAGQSQAA